MDLLLIIAALAIVALVLVGAVAIVWYIKVGFKSIDIRIKQSVLPKSLAILPPTNDIADLAIESWRLEKRLSKIEDKLTADENKALQNSVEKLKRFVQKNDIEVTDYAGQVYNEGMNLDILASEKDPELKQSVIFETHEPAVTHKGILIRKAKVIIHEK